MKVFVTGGTGFIGGTVVRRLRERGDDVVCLVRSPEKAAQVTALGAELVGGDLGAAEAMRGGMEGCDAVVHAAAMYEVGIPVKQHPAMWEANVAGTERVMKAALEARIPKVVYVSTCGVFGNTHRKVVDETYEHPGKEFTSYYEETKLEAHRIVKRMIEDGLPGVIVQPGGVYGPDDTSQVADLLQEFFAGKLPLLPFPEFGICMAHVDDIAAGILLALDKGRIGEAYVLSGPVTTMREAVETVAAVSGRKAPKRAMPVSLMKALTPIGPLVGKLMGQPPNLRELISSADGVTFWASHEKASRELGYAPRGMEEGWRQTLEADDRFPRQWPAEQSFLTMRVIDTMHLGRPHVIGCWQVGDALVDPGPESSLTTLLEALGDERPRALLLTHIHLDHAAATGALVRRWPDLEVYVHERGAPHLIDPSKLLASAERLYGDQMERLWGEIVPVPESNVIPLSGGERALGMRVAYTPGHASHHVCYLHEESGTAFVGDIAAVSIPGVDLIVPPTPPPDIDVETWEDSIGIVESWQPERLALTHFAAIDDPAPHLAKVRERLREEALQARDLSEEAYEQRHRALVAEHAESTEAAEELIQCVPPQYQWRGLDRYWTKLKPNARASARPPR